MSSDLLIEFSVDVLSGRGVKKNFLFVHQLPLDPYDRVVSYDPPNDIMSGSGGVAMANHLRAVVEDRFKRFTRKFVLASFAHIARDVAPHVGNENNILQCRITAEFLERLRTPPGDSGGSSVGDAVGVDDPGKLRPLFISVEKFSPEG